MTITLDGVALFCPGDKARFIDAHDVEVRIVSVHIYARGNVNYTVTWIHEGNLKEETCNTNMLEQIP